MKIAIIGTRGLPANYGGFETFAEELGVRLLENHEVLVIGDSSNTHDKHDYLGIRTEKSNYSKSKHPLQFYHDSLKIAKKWDSDIVVMCGVGGVFSIPFFQTSEMKVLVNPDGLGWKREKWVWWKKKALYAQFLFCAIFSKYIVCDSKGIKSFFENNFKRKKNLFVAEYGAVINPCINQADKRTFNESVGKEFNISANDFYLVVSRLEPENNVEIIIQGYIKSKPSYPLIIVGNTNTAYADHLLRYESDSVRFMEGVYNAKKLSALRFYSKAYFHGHSVGGTNPSLLEAMGSKNPCVAHDNIFNREVLDNNGFFFNDSHDVCQLLNYMEDQTNDEELAAIGKRNLERIRTYYNWGSITKKYQEIFTKIRNEK